MVRIGRFAGIQGARRLGLVVILVCGFAGFFVSCAPQTQRALSAPVGFAGPALLDDHVISFDGARLGLQVWAPPDGTPVRHALVAVHGMSEYADAFYLSAPYWAERGVIVYAYDQRGFGRSHARGVWPGTDLMVRDLQTVLGLVRSRHPGATLTVLGESMGAAVVMVADGQATRPLADRVILSAPGVRGWSALPIHYKVSLALAARIAPRRAVSPPRGVSVRATDNDAALIKNGRDPLFLRETRIDALHGLISLMEEAGKAGAGSKAPTLFLYGAKDELIPKRAAQVAVEALGPCARSALYPEGWHMLLRDQQAPLVWADVLAFLDDPDGALPSGVHGLSASHDDAPGTCPSSP